MNHKRRSDLESFFWLRGADIKFEYIVVGRYNYDEIYRKLNEIIDTNEDCCFDLTGGKELVLAAMGVVSEKRNIPMVQFNVRSGKLIRVKNTAGIPDEKDVGMKINECVVLNGGSVIENAKDDYLWKMTPDFICDVEIAWNICRRDCALWNRQVKVLTSFEHFVCYDDLSVNVTAENMKDPGVLLLLDWDMMEEFEKEGLICDLSREKGGLSFAYKNEQVHKCLCKAGNPLELYVYSLILELAKENPDYCDDVDVGVFVDWDGVVHNSLAGKTDTRNEIDLMMMHNLVPVLISCKNGDVHKEALYELETVANRYGGEYAKKILIATHISTSNVARKYILQRGVDMGIDIVADVDKMTKEELMDELRKRVR